VAPARGSHPWRSRWPSENRGWRTIEGTSDPDRARANRLARDGLLTEHIGESAARLGLSTIVVDRARALDEMVTDVTKYLGRLDA
jgi:hypothetical protein